MKGARHGGGGLATAPPPELREKEETGEKTRAGDGVGGGGFDLCFIDPAYERLAGE